MKFLAVVLIMRLIVVLLNKNTKAIANDTITRNEVRDPAAFRLRD